MDIPHATRRTTRWAPPRGPARRLQLPSSQPPTGSGGCFTTCPAGFYPKNFPSLLGLGTGSMEGRAGGGLQGAPSPDLASYPSQMKGGPLPSPSHILREALGARARRQRGAWLSEMNKGS